VLWLALTLVTMAAVLPAAAFVRWRRNQIAMRLDEPLDHGILIPVLAIGLGCLLSLRGAVRGQCVAVRSRHARSRVGTFSPR
jgi:uncharacterized membrane protein YidH (DUF202 family)